MRSFTYSYKPSDLMPERLALRCASAVLLALLPLPHVSAQGVGSINIESMDIESALQQERVKQQSTSQEVHKPQTEQMPLPQQQVQQQKPSLELQKPQALAPMVSPQTQVQKVEEKTKQSQQLTLEQQKQLMLTQQKLKQTQQQELSPGKPQQMTEKLRETERSLPEQQPQPQQLVLTPPSSLPQVTPVNPMAIEQEKYQKLLDAGVFSSSSGTTTNLDETMTRAQFAAIAAKLQELGTKSGGQFSEIDPASWAVLMETMTAKSLTGISSGSIKVESDDKKSSADFAALLAAVMKGQVSKEELDQLIAKLGASNLPASQVSTSSKSEEVISKANSTVEGIVTPPGSAAVAAAGIAGVSAGSLATIGTALAAAAAASIAASSSANNIALASALTVGADYPNVTPRANWPTNLNATYSGRLSGMLSDNSAVGGNLTMNVNFATIGSHASIPGSVQFDNNKGNASLNLVQLGGYVGGGMTGTYDSQAMTGYIRNGQFYGPAANAIKGSWDMTTNSVSGGGTFAATR